MNVMTDGGAAMAVSPGAIGLSAPGGKTARWCDERVEQLCSLIREGKTFTEVAQAMQTTRSAVSGQVDRMRCRQDVRLPAIPAVGRPGPAESTEPPKPASRFRSMPEDFAALSPTMSKPQLAKHYNCGLGYIARWRKECGVPGTDGAFKATPVPADFAQRVRGLTASQAAATYGRGVVLVRRWAEEVGVTFKPSPRGFAGNSSPVRIESKRDMSRAGRAAEFLQRISFVYRCDAKGGPDKEGAFWRRGSFVLTDAEIIERAERLGWDEHAWKRCAA